MALVGYARVSTEEQQTARQLDELRAAGCLQVVEEHASGADRDRPVLGRVLVASPYRVVGAGYSGWCRTATAGGSPGPMRAESQRSGVDLADTLALLPDGGSVGPADTQAGATGAASAAPAWALPTSSVGLVDTALHNFHRDYGVIPVGVADTSYYWI